MIPILLALLAQAPTFTNADLGRRGVPSHPVDAAALAGFRARQWTPMPPLSDPWDRVVVAPDVDTDRWNALTAAALRRADRREARQARPIVLFAPGWGWPSDRAARWPSPGAARPTARAADPARARR